MKMLLSLGMMVCFVGIVQAKTIAFWPLGIDDAMRPDGSCRVSSANDLAVIDTVRYCELGDTKQHALMATGGAEATDFAYSTTIGKYVTPTNDFTIEGWYHFARLPETGEVWMVVSTFARQDCRSFLTLRRDSFYPGVTWQLFSSLPNTGDSLLTTVQDYATLTNGWHHFALTFVHCTPDADAVWRFYLDGKQAGWRAVRAFEGEFHSDVSFFLGGRGRSGNVICGSLSDCRLSDQALKPADFLYSPKRARERGGQPHWKDLPSRNVPDTSDAGRTLYNGITLPKEWPPKIDPKDPNPIRTPYLESANIPKVIPIDLGRQLFVDDFLIESTNGVVRAFPKPVKYEGNPVMWRQTKAEMSAQAPGCAMSGGGVWWDPTRRCFRMWYMSGFAGRISYAESPDGVHWDRPDVGPNGDNVVLPIQTSDTFSVFPGYDTDAPYANWRICISPGGNPTRSAEYVSSDGIRWRFLRRTGQHGDCTTMFYNPFLGKWIWSLRANWRNRSRIYHAHRDFCAGADWHFPLGHGHAQTNTVDCALWLACDNQDLPRTMGDGKTYTNSQLYNVDAVPYESIMVSLFKILCGYENDIAARAGMPKTTSIHFAYSRDGFHFTRPDRTPAIDESGWGSGAWDTGYIGNISRCFVITDERLWFSYVGARGDGTKNDPPRCTYPNGMHWNFSVGVATLRRDGFAAMVADGQGTLVTRPVRFTGAHFFVNADARFGNLAVEVLDERGEPYPGYSANDCRTLV
ncbi:MAG: hypothetical protein IKR48_00830, partial [Kiritimatiellae bacterium]|nr:hypothetical protein [Kiritimatiellia bacterium]